jgi:hypothetical protein
MRMTSHGYRQIAAASRLRPIGGDQFLLGRYPRGVSSQAGDRVGLLRVLVHRPCAVSLGLVNGGRVVLGPGHGRGLRDGVDVDSTSVQDTLGVGRIRAGSTQMDSAAQQRAGPPLCRSAHACGGGHVLVRGGG